MSEDFDIYVRQISADVVDIRVPAIDIRNLPIFRDDGEGDIDFLHRCRSYAVELAKRWYTGEPYSIGYRLQSDGEMHLVTRRHLLNGITLQKIHGVDKDFTRIDIEDKDDEQHSI